MPRFFMALLMLFALSGCGTDPLPPQPEKDRRLQVRLIANNDGSLKSITFDRQLLGNDDASLQKLKAAITRYADHGKQQEAYDQPIDIIADQRLRFEFVDKAIKLCAGIHDEPKHLAGNRFEQILLKISGPDGVKDVPRDSSVYIPSEVDDYDRKLPLIPIGLTANADGSLEELKLGHRSLGSDELTFKRLNNEIPKIIGKPGNPLTEGIPVVTNADDALQFQFVARAIKACSGRFDSKSKQWTVFIRRIGFAGIGFPKPAVLPDTNINVLEIRSPIGPILDP